MLQTFRLSRLIAFAAAALAVAMLTGCPKPPQKALDDATQALLDAEMRKECADEKYRAAEQLLKEAQELVEQEEYEAAERKARAAEKLAREAREYADLNWEECQRRRELAEKARDPRPKAEKPEPTSPTEAPASLSTILFDYDSSDIPPSARATLEENVRWLRQNPDANVVLEGHTDERGTAEYNLALGERRARAVRQYLIQLGVDGERLQILSYGEEKPASFGASETDFGRNRRVEFVPQQ